MVNPLYVLVAGATLLVSSLMLARTRAMLRFRSPGRIEPGSIPEWKVWVWRLMAGVTLTMTVVFFAVVILDL